MLENPAFRYKLIAKLRAIAVNPDWQQKMDLLTSVPGIGKVVAVTLISSLPELGTISHKSISYLVGVAPLNRDSPKGFLKD